ncbi:MAG TPA: 3-hydroxyacyl-CoA dehydrogenase NAD-binding domain-containing protein, partial [Gemmatimonadaceae bacterium]|nr:3-hydroxyacyl-CoA dehydrogenase NAD-binding domain-containing protein [Gemmatimonadaceae bacterium]
DELRQALGAIQRDPAIRAAVIISGKRDNFIAGADIEAFLEFRTAEDAEQACRAGHADFQAMAEGKPVVCAIHGGCLGGGTELALAAHWRIATDGPKTAISLPEVQLGLIPGAGGTQRLPALIGLQAALDMILTGKVVRAKKALQLGLVDEMVHPAILRRVALQRAAELAEGTRRREPKHRGAGEMLLDENPIGRAIVFRKAKEGVLAKTKGLYPAPLAALDAVAAGYSSDGDGYQTEARLFGELAMTPESQELVFLFFATTALKRDMGVDAAAGGEPLPPALVISRLGILGAGFMGAGIASVAAPAGTVVRMKDADTARVAKGLAAVREVMREKLVKKQVTRPQFDDLMLSVSGTTDYTGFGNADLVIEAVFEDLQVKHQVLREIEGVVPSRAIVASNTSTIPIARIASASVRPERVLGMHFFSPVHKMPLLEIITHPGNDSQVVVSAVSYGRKIGKTVIVVRDGPGFFANRVLSPYVNAAGLLLDEGVSIDAIDEALVKFGFPVGPVTLIDEVGLDVATKAGAIVAEAFGARMAPNESIQRVIRAGRLGRKGRRGFYLYDDVGKKGGVDSSVYELLPTGQKRTVVPAARIVQRCVYAMLNEAVLCLEDGILRSARDGDIGAVFGIGFPPFRGGPFRFIDRTGAAAVVATLDELEREFPGRYQAAASLRQMAERRERFYPVAGKPV